MRDGSYGGRCTDKGLLDYADKYFPHANQHVRNTCPLPLRLLLFCIVKCLDPRVTQALEAHFFE